MAKLRALAADRVESWLKKGTSCRVDENIPPKFRVGDRVTVRNFHPLNHTRAPRYIRGRTGTIAIDHGVFIWPDTNAHERGKSPQHVYSVRFTGEEVWGPDGDPTQIIHIDLWDNYLEPA